MPESRVVVAPATAGSCSSPHWRWRALRSLLLLLALLSLGIAAGLVYELRTASIQSREIARYAGSLDYILRPGPSPSIVFPTHGPFDQRLGYVGLPRFAERLQARGYVIERQVRFTPALEAHVRSGYFPPYREKSQAGLDVLDCRGDSLFAFRYPQRHYASFAELPPLLVDLLLFVENRDLLDPQQPKANPAVDWPRLAAAAWSQLLRRVDPDAPGAGGSTLATQMEKYRHSPEGRTHDYHDKWRQMASAAVRAYRDGEGTYAARRRIVLDYLNTVPLAAAPGHGEVHGIGDGLWVWFGADFAASNRALSDRSGSGPERALALRRALALVIAQRRPSHYLGAGRDELADLTAAYLRLLAQHGIIDARLRDAALAQPLKFRDFRSAPLLQPMATDKGAALVRRRLSGLLDLPQYDLDRLDLAVETPLHGELQQAIGQYLRGLADPAEAARLGLFGDRLLRAEQAAAVRYSFTLFERDGERFAVRVQTDSTDQPFDLNESSKLELGSTAKLRVLATYLEVIAELHATYAERSEAELRALDIATADRLRRWAVDWLLAHPSRELPAMLDAALDRRYSASPRERFFTGGGLHQFGNFKREDDGRVPTLREALRESINLPFVRLLRDLVDYSIYARTNRAELLRDDRHPQREDYLRGFADREGRTFLLRFWRKYRGIDPAQRLDAFYAGLPRSAPRLAAAHRYLQPEAGLPAFTGFLQRQLGERAPTAAQAEALYARYAPGRYPLADQAYLARVHPLELWLVGFLARQPEAPFAEAERASAAVRQEAYAWLFRSRHKSARDSRIGTMLEVEAFLDLHQRWQRLGYPFAHLVPSLATAIGSSGDRPAALAELMGIILADGRRLPTVRIEALHFAVGTPYETHLRRQGQGEQVMRPEVAAALRQALSQVVEGGTARRLQGSFRDGEGRPLQLGGKTGTGDNRIEQIGAGGKPIASTAINRTATFVFYLGPDHFGTLTAFVPGREAAQFRFTSALPVQVLRGMEPLLRPHLGAGQRSGCALP